MKIIYKIVLAMLVMLSVYALPAAAAPGNGSADDLLPSPSDALDYVAGYDSIWVAIKGLVFTISGAVAIGVIVVFGIGCIYILYGNAHTDSAQHVGWTKRGNSAFKGVVIVITLSAIALMMFKIMYA
ncbi:MAG: hypothetical protein WCX48_09535 [Bacteroidales bacterium]